MLSLVNKFGDRKDILPVWNLCHLSLKVLFQNKYMKITEWNQLIHIHVENGVKMEAGRSKHGSVFSVMNSCLVLLPRLHEWLIASKKHGSDAPRKPSFSGGHIQALVHRVLGKSSTPVSEHRFTTAGLILYTFSVALWNN